MKIAIHTRKNSFSNRWIKYCIKNGIDFKEVNAYDDDIIEQLTDCDAFLWHHSHRDYRDLNFAKNLLFSIEQSGKKVFPNFNTGWHFDDKLGQKYLFEALKINSVKTWTFYDRSSAYKWIETTSFPKVFKLRGGAGSSSVYLIKNKRQAKKYTRKMFGSGMKMSPLRMAWDNFKGLCKGRNKFYDFAKYIGLFLFPQKYGLSLMPTQKGYVYFQEYIPNNTYDIRVIVIGNKAFAIKRLARENDFRASGSGKIVFERDQIDERCIQIAFDANYKLSSQCTAYDFIFNENNDPLIVEASYGFAMEAYNACPGYWDNSLQWHKEKFNPQVWILEDLINSIKQ